MIADLKPYPKYKPSHDWLGPLPAHWNILRAKCLFREVDQRSTNGREELLSVSHLTGVTPRSEKKVTMFLAKSNVGHKICQPGDVVINTMWAWMGALGVARHTGIVSPAYGVYRQLRDRGILPKYADHLLRADAYVAEYQRRSTGVNSSRLRLYPEHFLRIPIVVPPIEEQLAIVRFLNHANGRVEKAIRAKRKVIALLNEQKRAIIHHAVTRGLDTLVPLKASGIQWLGDIPEHWEVRKLRHLTRQIVDGTHFTPNYMDNGVAFLRVTDIHEKVIDESKLRRISRKEHLQLNKRCNPEKGDLLLSKNGTIGVTAVVDWDFPFSIFVSLCLIKPIKVLVNPYFISFAFSGLLAQQLADNTKTTSVTNLHLDKIRTLILTLPPLQEQLDIVVKIGEKIAPVDAAISRFRREIELLREYRNRLVADVVTGKLDVREVAAHLPEEAPPEADVPDDTDAIDEAELVDEEAAA